MYRCMCSPHTQVRELGSDKSRDQMAGELARAKQEVERLRKQLAGGWAAGGPGGCDTSSTFEGR